MTSVRAAAGSEAAPESRAPQDLAWARRPSLAGNIVATLLGPFRSAIVLIVIAIIFESLNSAFLTANNISNLLEQIVSTGFISAGVVLVLLLGEIDLSMGAVSGLAGAIVGVLTVKAQWNGWVAILIALAVGFVIGVLQGTAITRLKLPSFIVTLAGLLTWQGVQLIVLGSDGTINITAPAVTNLTLLLLPNWLTITLAVAALLGYVATQVLRSRRQRLLGTERDSIPGEMTKSAGIGVLLAVATVMVFANGGLALGVLLLVLVIALIGWVLVHTEYGRHVMAVGGNQEAARRVGIRALRLKVLTFGVASALAAVGGIMAASRLGAATTTAGGSDVLLLAIAGPVIAGVSLFGGKGSAWAALVGAVALGAISNGMDLLSLNASVKDVITGLVLFIAVALDALSLLRAKKGMAVGGIRIPVGRAADGKA